MKGKKIKIECVGNIFIFKTYSVMSQEHLQKLRGELMQQLKEGCVVLPHNVELVDVEPQLVALAEEYNAPEMPTRWKRNIMGKFEQVE